MPPPPNPPPALGSVGGRSSVPELNERGLSGRVWGFEENEFQRPYLTLLFYLIGGASDLDQGGVTVQYKLVYGGTYMHE